MNAHFVTRNACPACGAARSRTLFARPYADPTLRCALENFYAEVGQLDYAALLGAEFVVQRCEPCGLFFQRDVPDDFLLSQLYEVWISPAVAYERFHAHVSPVRQRQLARNVGISLALGHHATNPPRALDYGCGWGEWGKTTLALGAESWGTELSPTRRDACARLGLKVVSERELPDAYFDLINADQVFEHLPAPAATLDLLRKKLRPGGVIRIAVPNGWRIAASLRRFDRELQAPRLGGLNPIAPLEHLNGFTTRSLVRLGERCGLIRLIPPWRQLCRRWVAGPGMRTAVKQLLLPFYLRSNWSTQLWFEAAPSS